ncbi:MAG: hypothetical protein LUG51_04940 [Tannerellaceae bacterium]|nr:hypothetical protein [Tannerellaceae bacterium]
MDNLGDWLYIILLVVAGISGLFSSGKKKKTPTQVLGQPGMEDRVPEEIRTEQDASNPGKGFWQMLEEMSREQQPEKRSQKKSTRSSVQKKPKRETSRESRTKYETLSSRSFDRGYYTPPAETYVSPITSSLTDYAEEEQPEVPAESFNQIEEVRKAIIYTEILNRKY